jgi:spore maturation protein CgeB
MKSSPNRVLTVGINGDQKFLNSCSFALEQLGCGVKEYDYYQKFLNKKHLFLPYVGDITEKINYLSINNELISITQNFKPDFILLIKCNPVFPSTIELLQKKFNIKIFNWNPDNPFNRLNTNWLHKKAIKHFDIYFIWGKFLVGMLENYGAKEVVYLPFCYDPRFFVPVSGIEEKDKIYDVVFIGTWEKERELELENLTEFNLSIWGNSWENLKSNSPLKKFLKGKAVYGQALSEIYAKSKIILNFIRKQNGNAHNTRTFEVPACRQFLLTARTKEQLEFFQEGKEIECFGDLIELKQKILFYLRNPKLRAEIANNAYLKNYSNTFKNRMSQVLEIYKEATYCK